MKQVLSVLALAVVMTACNSNQENIGKAQQTPAADTAGLAEFQALKAQAALKAMEDSIRKSQEARQAAAAKTAARPKKKSNHTSTTYQSESIAYESTDAAKAEKKGWSKKAKGAIIGAGTGAAAGAVIHKKDRVKGGIVGGVVGAAAGYGVGRHKDKKDGRN
jgi:hypothetical protein